MKKRSRGFTRIEILIGLGVAIALGVVAMTLMKTSRAKAHQVATLAKMKALGSAFSTYATEKSGLMPYESGVGGDDWERAAKPENQEVWYNALPKLMNAPSVGEIGAGERELFYESSYPLQIPGAKYPMKSTRLETPAFAIGMNSQLRRKSEGVSQMQGRLGQIQSPEKTVVFLERGMPKDKAGSAFKAGFDASPKANARAFAARHNQKGILVFADGHAEARAASEIFKKNGEIITPQTRIVWTLKPDTDPN
jgi:prepilin-type processing-associated H-X9-DG protein